MRIFLMLFLGTMFFGQKIHGQPQISNSNQVIPKQNVNNYCYHAIIITAQHYQDKKIRSLSYPISDGDSLKQILTRDYKFKNENVICISDPTRKQIINSFESLAHSLTQRDHLLIFFAGHGFFDTVLKRGYWLPIDADRDEKSSWVSNNDIKDYMSAINARHILLITDACFGGSILDDNRSISTEKAIDKLLERKARIAMTSGLKENVPDRSVFVEYLLKGLKDNNMATITATDLFINKIQQPVLFNTNNTPQCIPLRDAHHEGGDFIFTRNIIETNGKVVNKDKFTELKNLNFGSDKDRINDSLLKQIKLLQDHTTIHGETLGTSSVFMNPELLPNEKDFVTIQGGIFDMGSNEFVNERPIHQVTISDFKMSRYEITQKQWQNVMGNHPSANKECENCPVEKISWDDAMGYIQKLNQLTGKHYRLPTEAEWEYAAKGGKKNRNFSYSGSNSISLIAWCMINSGLSTHPVGKKEPNELGLYDMTGNVWEWCSDWFDAEYYLYSEKNNPSGPKFASGGRVLRGGGYFDLDEVMKITHRGNGVPTRRDNDIGFRIVYSL